MENELFNNDDFINDDTLYLEPEPQPMDPDGTHYIDTNGDGIIDAAESYTIDAEGNYVYTIAHDYDQDGVFDMQKTFTDTDWDGNFEKVSIIHMMHDNEFVVAREELMIDVNGDATPDMHYYANFIDLDGDGMPDYVEVNVVDAYGQELTYGVPFSAYETAGYDLEYTTNMVAYGAAGLPQYDPSQYDPEYVVGNVVEDMERWEYQGNTGRCALYAQKFAIEEALGREVPIEELVAVAEENGWFYEEGGTATLNCDKLLDYYGVEHTMSFDNSIDDVAQALREGKNVLVTIDANQIWYGTDNNVFSPFTDSNHAVQVIGIDYSDPEHPMVILNDSGTSNGCGEMVALEVFQEAWAAGDTQMVVCNA